MTGSRFALALVAATLAALALAAPALPATGFTYGVTAGEVTSKSAVLWAHADRSGRYALVVWRDRRLRRQVESVAVRALAGNDNTVQRKVGGLRPGKRYWYRFRGGRATSDVGSFVTAPRPTANATVEFAVTGDTDLNPAPGQTTPYWNDGGIFDRMRAERNHFNIHFGDTIYSDSEIPGLLNPVALTVEQKWAKYRVNVGHRSLVNLRRGAGLYSHWDDHEFINDFARGENVFTSGSGDGETIYRAGVKAFRDYSAVSYNARDGLYRTRRWGRNLELFFLDQRSFRSPKASKDGVCDNPATGEPDLAPTGPQATRNLFAVVVPSLAQPVSQACLDEINDPDRTYLGKRQLARFLRAVRRSKARFKVIMNELPIQQFYALPYDRWEGYEAERKRVLRALQGVKNVVFLTTDVHATLVNDARFQTLEPGGVKPSGITDITVGPAATANFGLEIDTETGGAGNGALVDNVFFEGEPPMGISMRCSIVDQFSYGQVKVSSRRLTVTPKGIDGRPQRNADEPCGPFVFRYRR